MDSTACYPGDISITGRTCVACTVTDCVAGVWDVLMRPNVSSAGCCGSIRLTIRERDSFLTKSVQGWPGTTVTAKRARDRNSKQPGKRIPKRLARQAAGCSQRERVNLFYHPAGSKTSGSTSPKKSA